MTFGRKITFNEARNILAIMFYGTEEGKKINKVLCDVDENPWHTGIPTEEGWYVCKLQGIDIFKTQYFTGMNWDAHVIEKWQKINYEEEEHGHTD